MLHDRRGSLNLEMALIIALLVLTAVLSLNFMSSGIANQFNAASDWLLGSGGGEGEPAEDTMDYWLALSDDSTRILEQCGAGGTPYLEVLPDKTVRVVLSPAMVELLNNYNIYLDVGGKSPDGLYIIDSLTGFSTGTEDAYTTINEPFLGDSQYVLAMTIWDEDWNWVENKCLGVIPLKDQPEQTIVTMKVDAPISTPIVFWGDCYDHRNVGGIGKIGMDGSYTAIGSFLLSDDPNVRWWSTSRYNYSTNEYYDSAPDASTTTITRHDGADGTLLGSLQKNYPSSYSYEMFDDYYCMIWEDDSVLRKFDKTSNTELASLPIDLGDIEALFGPYTIKLPGEKMVFFQRFQSTGALQVNLIDTSTLTLLSSYDIPYSREQEYRAGKTSDGGFLVYTVGDQIFYEFDETGGLVREQPMSAIFGLYNANFLDGDILYARMFNTWREVLKIYDISGAEPVLLQSHLLLSPLGDEMDVAEFLN